MANPPRQHPPTGEFVYRSLGGGEKVKSIEGFNEFAVLIFIYCSIMNTVISGA
jgi:hypothetical protein